MFKLSSNPKALTKTQEAEEAENLARHYDGTYIGATLGSMFVIQVAYNAKKDFGESLYEAGMLAGRSEARGQRDAIIKAQEKERDELKKELADLRQVIDGLHQNIDQYREIVDRRNASITALQETLKRMAHVVRNWETLKGLFRELASGKDEEEK